MSERVRERERPTDLFLSFPSKIPSFSDDGGITFKRSGKRLT